MVISRHHKAANSQLPKTNADDPPQIAVVVPVLNEAGLLGDALSQLWTIQALHEIIVADGGSNDCSLRIAHDFAEAAEPTSDAKRPRITIVQSASSRGLQMNAGSAAAQSPILLFLHVDTRLPADAAALIQDAVQCGFTWGRFDVRLDGSEFTLRIIERAMNIRSAITGIATGDQAIFATRTLFQQAGGYPNIPLMEDVVLSKKLKRLGTPALIRTPVLTSARRWHSRGFVRTIGEMWGLRLMFALGIAPGRLVKWYYPPKT